MNFVKTDVYTVDGRLVYSGRMAYDVGRDISYNDAISVEDVLFRAQNGGVYRALDNNGECKAGSFLNRTSSNDPYYDFTVVSVINEKHPDYEKCVQDLEDIESGTSQPRRIIEPKDLSWDYIDKNTLWVAKMMGYRKVGTYEELKPYMDSPELRDVDTLVWEAQPEELQEFHKDYTYAIYEQNRHDLFYLKDFHNEWQKDPDQFKPKAKAPVIGKLSEYIDKLPLSDNLIVANYHGFGAGNHRAGNFYEALHDIRLDFDVIEYERMPMNEWDDRPTHKITIQTDDEAALNLLSRVSNENAIKHSEILGDGKYETPDDDGEGEGMPVAMPVLEPETPEPEEEEIEEAKRHAINIYEERLKSLGLYEEDEPDDPDDDFEIFM